MGRMLLLAVALAACAPGSIDNQPPEPCCEGDAGGTDPTPSQEVCDGYDNDLDGEVDEASRHIREVAELASGRADRVGLAMARYSESGILCDAGRIESARSSAQAAVDLTREAGNEVVRGLAESAMAKVHVFAGEPNEALAAAARGAEIAEQIGHVGMRYHAVSLSGSPLRNTKREDLTAV